ncbi:MAG: hypothetical protein HY320_07505 [Armatimonadetes bacterium]|nr:hypothetical protein [Armatimonadota bacterium]
MRTIGYLVLAAITVLLVGCGKPSALPESAIPGSPPPPGRSANEAQVQACVSRLRSYWSALQKYTARHKGKLPSAASTSQLVEKLGDDAPRDESREPAFGCPSSLLPYRWNENLNGKLLREIPDANQVPLVFDDPYTGDHGDRQCAVLYADGHTAVVSTDRLEKQMEALSPVSASESRGAKD